MKTAITKNKPLLFAGSAIFCELSISTSSGLDTETGGRSGGGGGGLTLEVRLFKIDAPHSWQNCEHTIIFLH